MSVSSMNSVTSEYEELKAACKRLKVRDQGPFKHLFKAVDKLISTDKSIVESPEMLSFIATVICRGQSVLKIYDACKQLSKFIKGITLKSIKVAVGPRVNFLDNRMQALQSLTQDLSGTIVKEISTTLKRQLMQKNRENQLIFHEFVSIFNEHIRMIDFEIAECQLQLSSIETIFKDILSK